MPPATNRFALVKANIDALRQIYVPQINSVVPTPEQQELARAYILTVHAELEFYIEERCREVSNFLISEVARGFVHTATLSYLVYSGLPAITGGDKLGKNGKASRKLLTQLSEARVNYEKLIDSNIGIREKHIAKILTPIGLSSDDVDPNFLLDIDILSSHRGHYAHMSRSTKEADPQAVNPDDHVKLVERVVNGPAGLAGNGKINSIADLDKWFLSVLSPHTVLHHPAVAKQELFVKFLTGIKRILLR